MIQDDNFLKQIFFVFITFKFNKKGNDIKRKKRKKPTMENCMKKKNKPSLHFFTHFKQLCTNQRG